MQGTRLKPMAFVLALGAFAAFVAATPPPVLPSRPTVKTWAPHPQMARVTRTRLAAYLAGQRVEPPDGWYCGREPDRTDGAREIKQCGCQRRCAANQTCDDDGTNCQPAPGRHVVEDAACKVFCHPDHCSCPVQGCQETH